MIQKVLLSLLPILLIFGLFFTYQSYQTIDSIGDKGARSQIHDSSLHISHKAHHLSVHVSVVSDHPVRVDFFVMSQCPDAQKCETLFGPTLLKLTSIVNFTLSFIGSERRTNEFECMHGENECLGNKQQLCVQHMYPQARFIQFLQCQSQHIERIPHNGEQCAKQPGESPLNWPEIQACVKSDQANELFRKSLQRTRRASASKSCTIHLNGKFWCMHDRTWYGCSEGRDERSLIAAICSRYNGQSKPAECDMAAAS